jgi:hypothetical protein
MVGVSKATLSKALKTGKLSYVEKTEKGYLIDTSELFRVFPVNRREPATVPDSEPTGEREETGQVVELLKAEVADLRQRLDQSEAERREGHARVIGLLSDQRPTGFWARLLGR